MDRIGFLENFLKTKASDAFARYALAMEYSKAARHDEALDAYAQLIQQNPDYSPGYFQWGLLLEKLGRRQDAIAQLEAGIAAATRTNDAHHRKEMQAFLDALLEQGED